MSCDRNYGVELFAADEDHAVLWTSEPDDDGEDRDEGWDPDVAGGEGAHAAERNTRWLSQLQTSGATRSART